MSVPGYKPKSKMNTTNLITAEGLAGRLKMTAEGIKPKPGLMKSAVPSLMKPLAAAARKPEA